MRVPRRYRIPSLLLPALLLPALLSACEPTDTGEQAEEAPTFRYLYERPPALGDRPRSAALALPATPGDTTDEAAREKAFRLARALGVELADPLVRSRVDPDGETVRFTDGRYRLKVYRRSGMVTFRDTHLYNRTLREQADLQALDRARALERTREIVDRLATAELLVPDQLLIDAARLSHRKERGVAGARRDGGEAPTPGPIEVQDTRVFVPRALDGLGVSGHGLRVVLDKRGRLAGLDLMWRELARADTARPLRFDMAEARDRFERETDLPSGARVEVQAHELVYYDPSPRVAVSFLEPAYLFVYRVLTPSEGTDGEFRVSKVLHEVLPAVEHDRRQLPSARQEKLRRLQQENVQERPQEPPTGGRTDEEEGGGN